MAPGTMRRMLDNILTTLRNKLPSQPVVIVEHSLKHDMDELVASILPRMSLAIVDDRNTAQAAGERVFKALSTKFACTHVTLEQAAADDASAEVLHTRSAKCDALVAVGSGTINDLCKYIAHMNSKPYIAIPTAASMNGYLSANASITMEGYKKTMPAQMPAGVLCDLSVIAAAPASLNKSGMGDSLARSTAQADWLLSHLVLGTAYDETPFNLLLPVEEELLANARGIALADMQSLKALMQTLLVSGLGMTAAGGSYPASQGEHMIAHTMEMMTESDALHGEAIGITTLTMARMQEKFLHAKPKLREDLFPVEKITELLGAQVAGEAKKAFAQKQERMRSAMIQNWGSVASRIEKIKIPAQRLLQVLEDMKAPAIPAALNWPDAQYDTAVNTARFLRDRFTFLDLK